MVKPMANSPSKTILLIENNPEQTSLIRAMFNDQGTYTFDLACVDCKPGFFHMLRDSNGCARVCLRTKPKV